MPTYEVTMTTSYAGESQKKKKIMKTFTMQHIANRVKGYIFSKILPSTVFEIILSDTIPNIFNFRLRYQTKFVFSSFQCKHVILKIVETVYFRF